MDDCGITERKLPNYFILNMVTYSLFVLSHQTSYIFMKMCQNYQPHPKLSIELYSVRAHKSVIIIPRAFFKTLASKSIIYSTILKLNKPPL